MGISERRAREKEARRRAILASAKGLVMSLGAESVSMDDIARSAEVSKATLYQYFRSKEALFNEICEESARDFLEHLGQLANAGAFGENAAAGTGAGAESAEGAGCKEGSAAPAGGASSGGAAEGATGIEALRRFWRGYVEMFGSGDEMIAVFRLRSFLAKWPDAEGQHQGEGQGENSPYIGAILGACRAIVEQCKAEGTFDPGLNSAGAVSLMLLMFSTIVQNAAGLPREAGGSPAMVREMTSAFQIAIRGFAKEGVEHSRLDITGA